MTNTDTDKLIKELEEITGKTYEPIDVDNIPCEEISDQAVLDKQPLVSVNMITYNHEPYIAQAIEGVVNQKTDYPFELIIGEDCSTDRTREIVLEYQKKYPDIIRVLYSENNLGARRNGLRTEKACRGKYIAYCEGDDYWIRDDKLQIQVSYLEEHPDVGMVHSRAIVNYLTEDIKKVSSKPISLEHENRKTRMGIYLTANNFIITCTVVFRANYLKLFHTDSIILCNLLHIGDVQRWVKVISETPIHFFDEILGVYNKLPISATKPSCKHKYLEAIKMERCLYLFYLQGCNLFPRMEAGVSTKFFRRQLRMAIKCRIMKDAKEAYYELKRLKALSYKDFILFFLFCCSFKSMIFDTLLYKVIR
ncbi:glycosyltransferase [Sedimentisphaera salicampi]|uniref:glycosyltransferase n=1 Tax=Sedimentisphaera salicampi TaxID=1941349 RepID=UPI000B9CA5FD|nr:glycosyltransferase [Sedimentisphaera salicampi]OXU15576.1 putative glycosyltransferase EpsE [Sedimentisphaera salicampi]